MGTKLFFYGFSVVGLRVISTVDHEMNGAEGGGLLIVRPRGSHLGDVGLKDEGNIALLNTEVCN